MWWGAASVSSAPRNSSYEGPSRAALVLGAHAAAAGAEPRQLSEKRDGSYYALHLGLTVGGGLVTIGGEQLFGNHGPGPYWGSFHPDDLVQLNFSQAAAGMSDRLLMVAVLAPLFTAMGNATLIYGEAHAANLFITVTTKLAARRPRPYTHSPDPRVQEFADLEGGDAYVSFFSGHSSASFTAATAGSLLSRRSCACVVAATTSPTYGPVARSASA